MWGVKAGGTSVNAASRKEKVRGEEAGMTRYYAFV
jgi:hypothetical protein